MNLIIVGPCGVGKSTVAKAYAYRRNLVYFDFDNLGKFDMQKRKRGMSPFSVGGLNFSQALPPLIIEIESEFVLDIGGHNVFRRNVDNDERLDQVFWIKRTYTSLIVVLTAIKTILQERFFSSKGRKGNDFDGIWEDWVNIAEPYYKKCGDIFIDTSFLTVNETIKKIEVAVDQGVELI